MKLRASSHKSVYFDSHISNMKPQNLITFDRELSTKDQTDWSVKYVLIL